MTAQFIEKDGRPAFAVLPVEEYERLTDRLDELEACRAFDRWQADPGETVPAEVVDALLGGANPVRVWREHRGLTQQALAAAAGITAPYLSQIEAGRREPTVAVLKALATALEVDLDDLA